MISAVKTMKAMKAAATKQNTLRVTNEYIKRNGNNKAKVTILTNVVWLGTRSKESGGDGKGKTLDHWRKVQRTIKSKGILNKLVQKRTETKRNYAKKPNRILITCKWDKRKECDDNGKNARTNRKHNKRMRQQQFI